jgi:membrane peptidoglycan carboxypeptidase
MRHAIIAIEDARYYDHGAFDIRGTVRALVNDLRNTAVQGGSTIAQQYVKNALILTATTAEQIKEARAPTATRKIRELRMAAIVEHEMTKNQLLAAYLNAAYFENQAVGIAVAAQRYFRTTAAKLTLPQAAMLAGMVENPSFYDPVTNPKNALDRRNEVLQKMVQQGYVTPAAARVAEAKPLGLHMHSTTLQSGCTSHSARRAAFFCDYVLAAMRTDPAYRTAYNALRRTGGLKIYTTLGPQDQRAAQHAVNFIEPAQSSVYNPGRNVDTEVLIRPGTGEIRAIAVDRPYGNGPGHTTVDYAVNLKYDGSGGVQTGSSSKIFTLLTALKQGVPFGFNMPVVSPSSLNGYYNCKGQPTGVFNVGNAEGPGKGIFTLYNGTTQSINVFYAQLERKVGLCNVVKTAVSLGMTRGDGTPLLRPDKGSQPYSADNYPSFTLGAVNVSPLNMAAAYATVAARGIYCKPIAIARVETATGQSLPVESAGCHRVLPAEVADAANFILQGVLTTGTAGNRGIGRPAAAKTGTANKGYYAAFAGWTPHLAGYVSVFNPIDPTTGGQMLGYPHACYREVDGSEQCPPQMFGDNAPGATWQMTFLHANLGPSVPFVGVPTSSPFFQLGNGFNSPKPPKPKKPPKKPKPGHGGGPGNGTGGGPPNHP